MYFFAMVLFEIICREIPFGDVYGIHFLALDAAHGNPIVIPGLEIPGATPLVYGLDADLKPIPNKFSSRLMAIPSVPS